MTIHLPIVTVINSRGTRDLILIMLEKNWSHNLPKKREREESPSLCRCTHQTRQGTKIFRARWLYCGSKVV